MTFWSGYFSGDFSFADFALGAKVLDVGFGEGHQMRELSEAGCVVSGVDFSEDSVARGRAAGLSVIQAPAEALPFPALSFDALVCKVVLPYTDEALAISEWARVLCDRGEVRASFHGVGYYLRYILEGNSWQERVYGARAIVNGWLYSVAGRRLPGFWGDTIYQSESRLRRYYRRHGFEIVRSESGKSYYTFPVFIYHSLRVIKRAS